jgi:AraC-like DNA-binding protein
MYSKSEVLVGIIFINIGSLSYLTGPMLYWYIRSILTDNSRLRKRDLWHLLPMLIFLAGTLNYIFTPWSYKLEIASKLVENPNFIGTFKEPTLYQVVPKYIVFLSRPVLILAYAIWSLVAMTRFLMNKTEIKVLSHQRYLIKWLLVLLGFLFILVLSHTFLLCEAFIAQDTRLLFTLNFMQILSAIGLTGLLISPFFFPGILYGLPQLPTPASLAGTNKKSKILQGNFAKHNPDFETEYLLSIQQKADAYMKEFQPYLQADCNLAFFSKMIKIPAHHLAYYFREEKKQAFNDYRNEWRIVHFKNLIREGKSKELTLEAIGSLSGFSSRNAFFNAFKRFEGVSPGVWAAQSST